MKDKIIKYLADRFEETDMIIIDELVYNLEIIAKCKFEIKKDGIVVTAKSRGGDITTKINPALMAYNAALKNIKELCVKLGITVQDREKLKLVKPKVSEFDKSFN